jgi:DNA polymerase-3 subunit alpha
MQKSKFKQLINPHSHSDHSLDGAATVKQIVKRNKELGATHVTLTEHGNMNSAMELYMSSEKEGIKPILGIEAYLVNPFHEEYVEIYRKAHKNGLLQIRGKTPDAIENAIQRKAMNHYLHITIHFKDSWAYQYFCKLSPAMWKRSIKKYDEEKPMITMEELEGAAGHITIGSSCLKGPVQYFMLPSKDGLIQPQPEKSIYMYEWLKRIAGKDGFFVEVFPHEITHEWVRPEKDFAGNIIKDGYFKPNECTCHAPTGDIQQPLNKWVVNLADKNKDKVIISLDSHFATANQKVIQDARLGNGDENWRFYNSYHIMTTEEASLPLKKTLGVSDKTIEEWVDNSYAWASNFDNFSLQTSKERWILAGNSERFMYRLKSTIDKWGRMNWDDQAMVSRLRDEIQTLAFNKKLNLLAYIETIEDIANFCRENGILMNVRGSAGGSLLLYLVGVSAFNPLRHDLSFGRFLTEGRIEANNLPDVDMDVSDQEKVIEYLKSKYGDAVCRLSTDLLLRIKSSIKDAERSLLGRVRKETEDMCKKLPSTPQGTEDIAFVFGVTNSSGEHTPGIFDKNLLLQKYAADNPEIWNMVTEMLGVQRNKSSHACGFIICDKPVTEYMPVIKVNGEWVTGYSPKSAEAAGAVKFDLLGLNTLRDIQLCLESIKKRTGQTIDPWNLPYDEEVWDAFVRGELDGVFQFDTPTIKPYVIKTKPRSIDAAGALTALGRPGTLDAPAGDGTSRTLAELYVARANGEPTQYLHPDLEPILCETYGIQLYQEQTMKIFTTIGGMSDAEADEVRRGIGKKIKAVLDKASQKLKEKCLQKNWTEHQVNTLMQQIQASANYSFNKSHAISYAYVAYACIYLKTKYKLDWWKAILSNASKDELATKFWKNVQDFTTLPDINLSTNDYEIVEDRIVAPLSILTGVGEKAYESLMKHKPYKSLEHFVRCHFPTKEEEDQKKMDKKTAKEAAAAPKADKKSAVNAGIARKLIAAGVLDSLFEPGLLIEEKLYKFEQVRGEVRGKRPERVPEEYTGASSLGKYLLKKELIQIHSDDLREIMLPVRGGKRLDCRIGNGYQSWFMQDGVVVLDGNQIQWLRKAFEAEMPLATIVNKFDMMLQEAENGTYCVPSQVGHEDRLFYAVGYTIGEKAFPYKNKTKQANRLVLDFNGYFTEEMLWPEAEKDQAPLGFKGLPVLAHFRLNKKGVYLKKVIPLLNQNDLEKYNMT